MLGGVHQDVEACYRAISSRDARFDGRFFTAVTSTGIYCRPVCPAQTPLRANVRFYPSAAAAQAAGFRACLRCRPHLAPGPSGGGPIAERALRLIAAGAADGPDGVAGIAERLGVSERHLHRTLHAAVGAGPLSLARMRRVQTARTLLEQTGMPITDVALCAGFSSLRQFNDAVREGLGRTPTELRRRGPSQLGGDGAIVLRLGVRAPFDGPGLLRFFALRAVPEVERVEGGSLTRSLRLGNGEAVVQLHPGEASVTVRLWLQDMRDLGAAVERCRVMFDLEADPEPIAAVLGADPLLRPLLHARPGLRIPGGAGAAEIALRAILGQQVSVTRATVLAARLTELFGEPLLEPRGGVTRLFPTPAVLAEAELSGVGLTRERAATVVRVAEAISADPTLFEPGAEPSELSLRLRAIRGVGEWTAAYVAMRGLGDPDAFPATDLALRRSFARTAGGATAPLAAHAERWRPWRAYATLHLWSLDSAATTATTATETAA